MNPTSGVERDFNLHSAWLNALGIKISHLNPELPVLRWRMAEEDCRESSVECASLLSGDKMVYGAELCSGL